QTKMLIQKIRKISKELNTHVGLMLDTKGPEIRTHQFDGLVTITKNSQVTISMQEVLGNSSLFSVTYPHLYYEIKINDTIYVDDGYLSLVVKAKDNDKREIITQAQNTHVVKSRRGINVPNVNLNMEFISPKDHQDIIFAIEQDFDYIAASFVRRAQDVKNVQQILNQYQNKHIQIISKIENQEGIDNLDDIIKLSDGIMVARGDLGIEVPIELIPIYQKQIIEKCLIKGKPVIVATQMLESMQKNPFPTRAEISDVFNAVVEGTTFTMLSGESAAGKYPLETVQYMSKINHQAEKVVDYFFLSQMYEPKNTKEHILLNSVELALKTPIKAIIVNNLEDAVTISKFHPSEPILSLVKSNHEAQRLMLCFGVIPFTNESLLKKYMNYLNETKEGNYIFIENNIIRLQ
ncbi:pyruvate kinase, partial [Candidatus Phytoplasma phoenicium]